MSSARKNNKIKYHELMQITKAKGLKINVLVVSALFLAQQ